MSEWPMKMWAWRNDNGRWQAYDGTNYCDRHEPTEVLVYPADAAPQPVGSITVCNQQVVSASNVMLCATLALPDGKYGLFAAPPDADAIRQEERERIATWLENSPACFVTRPHALAKAIRRGEMT